MAQKRGKERGPFWLGNSFILIAVSILAVGIFYSFNRDPSTITLKLGELKQILRDPGVVFQNVYFNGRTELRGQIVTRDPVSDGGENGERTHTYDWRATIRDYD